MFSLQRGENLTVWYWRHTALRILINITRQIHRLDISHNFLGREGIATLIQGLTSIRTRYATNGYKDNIWGIKELNLGSNGIDDEALSNILGYAKKDVCLRKVFVQGNVIEVSSKGHRNGTSLRNYSPEQMAYCDSCRLAEGPSRLGHQFAQFIPPVHLFTHQQRAEPRIRLEMVHHSRLVTLDRTIRIDLWSPYPHRRSHCRIPLLPS